MSGGGSPFPLVYHDNWTTQRNAAMIERRYILSAVAVFTKYALRLDGAAFRHVCVRGNEIIKRIMASVRRWSDGPPAVFQEVIKDKSFAGRADAIIVCGSNQAAFFQNLTGRANVHFVPHGIDTEFFRPPSGRGEGAFNTLSVGWWLRDVEMILRIVRAAADRSLNIVVKIITFPQYFDFYRGLDNVRLSAGLSDDDLKTAYQRSDALLLPLKDFTANNAVLESMVCGKPILTTDVGGLRDYVDESCAYLARPGDDQILLNALITLMENPGKKEEMGRAARTKALEFDWRTVAQKTMAIYERICA